MKRSFLLPALSFGNLSVAFGGFVIPGVIRPMTDHFGLSASAASLSMTIYALVYVVSSPVLVALTGRADRRTILAIALLLFAAGNLLTALAPVYWGVLIGRALAAIGAGLFTPNVAAVAIAVTAPERRGRALAIVFFGMSISQVIAMPIGTWLGYALGWQAAPMGGVVLALLALGGVIWQVPRGVAFQPSSLGDVGRALRDPVVMGAVLVTASICTTYHGINTFMGPLFEQRAGADSTQLSITFMLVGIGAVVATFMVGRLVDTVGPSITLAMLPVIDIVLFPLMTHGHYGFVAACVFAFVYGIANWSYMPPQQARLVAIAPTMQNVVLALNSSSNYVGTAAGAAIGGAILDWSGYEMLGLVTAGFAVLTLVHLFVSDMAARRRKTKGAAEAAPSLPVQ